jgi:opacity protein-like surface antigen
MRPGAIVVFVTLIAAPASAQVSAPPPAPPNTSVRLFGLVSAQQFAAGDTFDAVFGGAVQPFFGGGLQSTIKRSWFIEGTISYFRKTGERAFVFQGETIGLGIPLTASMLPLEFTAGYRFLIGPNSKVTPYLGGGVGAYKYKESSDFDESGDEFEATHAGYQVVAGAEFRMSRRLWSAIDIQYTSVPGILGEGGVSAELGDDDLGGIAVRYRLMVGN